MIKVTQKFCDRKLTAIPTGESQRAARDLLSIRSEEVQRLQANAATANVGPNRDLEELREFLDRSEGQWIVKVTYQNPHYRAHI